MLYKHNKTNEIYDVVNTNVINATNGEQDQQKMVMYYPVLDQDKIFVREKSEFFEKFTLLNDDKHTYTIKPFTRKKIREMSSEDFSRNQKEIFRQLTLGLIK